MNTASSANMIAFDLDGLVEFDAEGPCIKVLAETGDARVVLIGLLAGQELPKQHVPSQLLVQTLRGKALFHAGDMVRPAEVGGLLLIEENVPHYVEAVESCVLLLTLTPSPRQGGTDTTMYAHLPAFVSRQGSRTLPRGRGRVLPTVSSRMR